MISANSQLGESVNPHLKKKQNKELAWLQESEEKMLNMSTTTSRWWHVKHIKTWIAVCFNFTCINKFQWRAWNTRVAANPILGMNLMPVHI